MASRIAIETKVASLAKRLGKDLAVDYYAHGGGYCLTDSTGSRRYTQRMTATYFDTFLSGMDLVVDMHKRDAWLTALHEGCKE